MFWNWNCGFGFFFCKWPSNAFLDTKKGFSRHLLKYVQYEISQCKPSPLQRNPRKRDAWFDLYKWADRISSGLVVHDLWRCLPLGDRLHQLQFHEQWNPQKIDSFSIGLAIFPIHGAWQRAWCQIGCSGLGELGYMGGFPVLEQPLRSVMTALPSWQWVVAYFDQVERAGWIGQRLKLNPVNMACFNAPTLKPTAFYSTETFDPLMNMDVPPKNKRPKPEAPPTHQCHGLREVCVCERDPNLFFWNVWRLGMSTQMGKKGLLAAKASSRHSSTLLSLEGHWLLGGLLTVQYLPGLIFLMAGSKLEQTVWTNKRFEQKV